MAENTIDIRILPPADPNRREPVPAVPAAEAARPDVAPEAGAAEPAAPPQPLPPQPPLKPPDAREPKPVEISAESTADLAQKIAAALANKGAGPPPLPPPGAPGPGPADIRVNPDLDAAFGVAPPAAPGATPPGPPRPPVAPLVSHTPDPDDVQKELNRQHERRQADAQKATGAAAADYKARLQKAFDEAEERAKFEDLQAKKRDDAIARGAKEAQDARDKAERAEKEARRDDLERMRTLGQGVQTAALSEGAAGKVSGVSQIAAAVPELTAAAIGPEAAALLAAPEVAAAAALYEVAEQLVRMPYQKMREGIESVGKAGDALARNDLGAIGEQFAEGAADFTEKAGLAGVVAAEAMRTVTAGVTTAKRVIDSLVERGRQIQGFSAPLAAANAQADVQRLRDDIREAKVTGEELARLTKAQSDLESLGREILTGVKAVVIDAAADVLEPLGEMASEVKPLVKEITDHQRAVRKVLAPVYRLPWEGIITLVRVLLKWLPDNDDSKGPGVDLIDGMVERVKNLTIGGAPNQTEPVGGEKVDGPTWFVNPDW